MANPHTASPNAPTPTPPPFELIDLPEVRRITGRSRTAIYDDPTFPLPISISEPGLQRRHSRWLRHEVEGWLQGRIAERDADAARRRQEITARRERSLARKRMTPQRRTKRGKATATK